MTFSHLFNLDSMTPLHALSMLLLAPDVALRMTLTSDQRSNIVANVTVWVVVAGLAKNIHDIREYFNVFMTDVLFSDTEYLQGFKKVQNFIDDKSQGERP